MTRLATLEKTAAGAAAGNGRRLRRALKALVPPVLVRTARALRPEWRYVGTDAALVSSAGWQHPSVAETQRRKWPRWRELIESNAPLAYSFEAPDIGEPSAFAHNVMASFGCVLALAARRAGQPFRILDWGGGIGYYQPVAARLLPDTPLDYTVVDVPDLMAAGRAENPAVKFLPADEALAARYDFVFASGSLQFAADWRALLSRLLHAADSYLYVARVPVVAAAPSFVAAQRARRYGYRAEYRGWCFNRAELLGAVGAQARLLHEFLLEEYPPLARAPEQPVGYGFLYARTGA